MTYEQKYNKLVEAIKVLQETNPSDEGIQNWVNENVPELKESEDERIRKAIICYIGYGQHCGVSNIDMIAWLEKQSKENMIEALRLEYEQGKADVREQFEKERLAHCDTLTPEQAQIESDFVTSHLKEHNRTPTFIDAIEYGMKLQEQKLSNLESIGEDWSEEDEEFLRRAINAAKDSYPMTAKWLKSFKQRIGE